MFQTLIYPSSGACDCVDELPHPSSCSVKTDVLAISVPLRCVVVCSVWCVLSPCCNWWVYFKHPSLQNKTTDVVIHQQSRRLLKMDILMSKICWAHNNWNKITSDIKLVFHSSTIAMMHGPINIRLPHNSSKFQSDNLKIHTSEYRACHHSTVPVIIITHINSVSLFAPSWSTDLRKGSSKDRRFYRIYNSALTTISFVFINSFSNNLFLTKKKN